jgi:hypothetical protein
VSIMTVAGTIKTVAVHRALLSIVPTRAAPSERGDREDRGSQGVTVITVLGMEQCASRHY